MEPTDVTVAILREIRDEIRGTNERLEQTRDDLKEELTQLKGELTQTREELTGELTQTREDLGRRITQSEVRTATAIAELAGAVQSVKDCSSIGSTYAIA